MTPEVIYLAHDNRVDLLLKADGVAVDLAAVFQITLKVGTAGALITSTNLAGDKIRWAQAGYATGEVRIDAGDATLTPGNYDAYLTVYDASNPDGVVWGHFHAQVVADVEL